MANEVACQNRCSLLELLILAILIKEGKLHGYALYKHIVDITQTRWKPSIGTIYRFLNDMARRGLVLKNVKDRKYEYEVTHKGIEYFIENMRNPLIRLAGILATSLESYFKVAEKNPNILSEDIKERLRTLKKILDSNIEFTV